MTAFETFLAARREARLQAMRVAFLQHTKADPLAIAAAAARLAQLDGRAIDAEMAMAEAAQ